MRRNNDELNPSAAAYFMWSIKPRHMETSTWPWLSGLHPGRGKVGLEVNQRCQQQSRIDDGYTPMTEHGYDLDSNLLLKLKPKLNLQAPSVLGGRNTAPIEGWANR